MRTPARSVGTVNDSTREEWRARREHRARAQDEHRAARIRAAPLARRNFVYTVKVTELITHTKRFSRTATLMNDFGLIADLLGPRFGCFLFQLPPSFQYSAVRLARILGQLDPRRRNLVEFRHRSWWNDKVYAAFRDAGAIFCSTSGPHLPDELVQTADASTSVFAGRNAGIGTSPEELAVRAERVRSSGARTVWAYFNNDREGYAIRNARTLMRLMADPGMKMASRPTVTFSWE